MTKAAIVLALVGVLSGTAAICSAEGRVKWWLDQRIQLKLHLTTKQIQTISRIFDNTLPKRRRLRMNLDRAESDLAQAIDDGDEQRATRLVDVVTTAQIARGRARTLMLWHMYQALSPAQRQQFSGLMRGR